MKTKSGKESPWTDAVGAGWKSIVEPLITLCENEGAEILQVKEKFGQLRFYVSVGRGCADNSEASINEAIKKAEQLSGLTCETCGKPGTVRSRRGWLKCSCDSCF